ncbi:MAG: YkgJ family cysteine cluster protein, partial [Myxococcales bacterium]|nr:YkgJ family cysteine cluster protein [Myxococcales bacterium]
MSERAPSAERSLRALATRVDDFERAAVARGADLRCGLGCEACCHVSLSLAPLEAHVVSEALATSDAATLARLDARRSDARVVSGARCVMLEDDGRCAIYDARPLVCRSQGLALAYPPGVVPLESVMATLDDDDDDAHEHERDEREERDERDE